jgi:hypothetical protein
VLEKYGERLLEMCMALGLYIFNGRLGCDKDIGRTTCKDASLVDYVIGSAELFQCVNSFRVLPFDPMLSDCHNPIQISFCDKSGKKEQPNPITNKSYKPAPRKPKWKPDLKQEFINNIEISKIEVITERLSTLEVCPENCTAEVIDNIVQYICGIFNESAIKCQLVPSESGLNKQKVPKTYKRQRPKKPWFNAVCEGKRKLYNKAKNVYNANSNPDNRVKLKEASKSYKVQINREYKMYHQNLLIKLRSLKSDDPKEYWALLKDI